MESTQVLLKGWCHESITDPPTYSVTSSTPKVCTQSTEKLEWKRQKAKFYHDRHATALTWAGDWSRSQNSTLAEEPNVQGSYLYWETFRQVICNQIRQWVLPKKQAVSETCRRTLTNQKQSTKAGSQEPKVTHKSTTQRYPGRLLNLQVLNRDRIRRRNCCHKKQVPVS